MNTTLQIVDVQEDPEVGNPRVFNVILDRPADADEIAAALCDTGSIPRPGENHPSAPGLVARPPMIYQVGLREDGVVFASRSCFVNVAVHYVAAPPAEPAPLETQEVPHGGR